MKGLGEAERGAVAPGAPRHVQVLRQALDEVVFGETHALVRAHAVVAQVLLTVEAVRARAVAFVARAALRLRERVLSTQQTPAPHAAARALILGGHHHVQQVAEQKVGRGQRVHARLGHGHFLVAGGAAELQRVSVAPQALQARPAEGVQARQDVQSACRRGSRRAGGLRRRGGGR